MSLLDDALLGQSSDEDDDFIPSKAKKLPAVTVLSDVLTDEASPLKIEKDELQQFSDKKNLYDPHEPHSA